MREINPERLVKDVRRVLDNSFWITELEALMPYTRTHDDTDGTGLGKVCVTFSEDGDVWLQTDQSRNEASLRFRTEFGGGTSPRVRNALMILAFAIKLDNEERPQT